MPASWTSSEPEAPPVCSLDELAGLLGLPADRLAAGRPAARDYPLLVPRSFVARMTPGDPDDPLLRQVLPCAEELRPSPGFRADPLDEARAVVAPGLLQKYAGRALLLATHACPLHCRYCFRRHAHASWGGAPELAPALAHVASDPTLHEVILSGGDPLMLPDVEFGVLFSALAGIPHLRRVRLHTRVPVAWPERVTARLVQRLRRSRLTPVMVIHANHANELAGECVRALQRLRRAGVPLLSQSVLLRGVNDTVQALGELCERLADLGVMPYYLHALDPVAGAAHFAVPEPAGRRLVAGLRARLPGYAVPRFVREVASAPHKVVLA